MGYDSPREKPAVKTPDGEFPPEEEIPQLRARIAKLEEEISLIRGDIEGPNGRAAEALRESDQYKEVFDNISACMFLIDVTSDGRFKYAGFNPAEEEAVGLTNAEVCGKFVEEVFAEDLAKKLNATYRRCLEAGVPINYEDELDFPSGRRYFNSNLIPCEIRLAVFTELSAPALTRLISNEPRNRLLPGKSWKASECWPGVSLMILTTCWVASSRKQNSLRRKWLRVRLPVKKST